MQEEAGQSAAGGGGFPSHLNDALLTEQEEAEGQAERGPLLGLVANGLHHSRTSLGSSSGSSDTGRGGHHTRMTLTHRHTDTLTHTQTHRHTDTHMYAQTHTEQHTLCSSVSCSVES